MMYQVDEARKLIADAGYVSAISAQGRGLVVYEGDEHDRSTWMEVGRLAISKDGIRSSALQNVVGN